MISLDDNPEEYSDEKFKNIDLSGKEVISKEFDDCTFVRCDLSEVFFRSCTFLNCKFKNCDLSLARFKYSAFTGTLFQDSKIIGVDWSEVLNRRKSIFSPVKFIRCTINHSTFIGLKLKKISIKDSISQDGDFRDADLSESNLSGTDFKDSLFSNTNLSKADFRRAKNYSIKATANKIEKARFSMPEAISLLYGLNIILDD